MRLLLWLLLLLVAAAAGTLAESPQKRVTAHWQALGTFLTTTTASGGSGNDSVVIESVRSAAAYARWAPSSVALQPEEGGLLWTVSRDAANISRLCSWNDTAATLSAGPMSCTRLDGVLGRVTDVLILPDDDSALVVVPSENRVARFQLAPQGALDYSEPTRFADWLSLTASEPGAPSALAYDAKSRCAFVAMCDLDSIWRICPILSNSGGGWVGAARTVQRDWALVPRPRFLDVAGANETSLWALSMDASLPTLQRFRLTDGAAIGGTTNLAYDWPGALQGRALPPQAVRLQEKDSSLLQVLWPEAASLATYDLDSGLAMPFTAEDTTLLEGPLISPVGFAFDGSLVDAYAWRSISDESARVLASCALGVASGATPSAAPLLFACPLSDDDNETTTTTSSDSLLAVTARAAYRLASDASCFDRYLSLADASDPYAGAALSPPGDVLFLVTRGGALLALHRPCDDENASREMASEVCEAAFVDFEQGGVFHVAVPLIATEPLPRLCASEDALSSSNRIACASPYARLPRLEFRLEESHVSAWPRLARAWDEARRLLWTFYVDGSFEWHELAPSGSGTARLVAAFAAPPLTLLAPNGVAFDSLRGHPAWTTRVPDVNGTYAAWLELAAPPAINRSHPGFAVPPGVPRTRSPPDVLALTLNRAAMTPLEVEEEEEDPEDHMPDDDDQEEPTPPPPDDEEVWLLWGLPWRVVLAFGVGMLAVLVVGMAFAMTVFLVKRRRDARLSRKTKAVFAKLKELDISAAAERKPSSEGPSRLPRLRACVRHTFCRWSCCYDRATLRLRCCFCCLGGFLKPTQQQQQKQRSDNNHGDDTMESGLMLEEDFYHVPHGGNNKKTKTTKDSGMAVAPVTTDAPPSRYDDADEGQQMTTFVAPQSEPYATGDEGRFSSVSLQTPREEEDEEEELEDEEAALAPRTLPPSMKRFVVAKIRSVNE